MKLFKKLLWLLLAAAMVMGFVSCSDDDDDDSDPALKVSLSKTKNIEAGDEITVTVDNPTYTKSGDTTTINPITWKLNANGDKGTTVESASITPSTSDTTKKVTCTFTIKMPAAAKLNGVSKITFSQSGRSSASVAVTVKKENAPAEDTRIKLPKPTLAIDNTVESNTKYTITITAGTLEGKTLTAGTDYDLYYKIGEGEEVKYTEPVTDTKTSSDQAVIAYAKSLKENTYTNSDEATDAISKTGQTEAVATKLTTPTITVSGGTVTVTNAAAIKSEIGFDKFQIKVGSAEYADGTWHSDNNTFTVTQTTTDQSVKVKAIAKVATNNSDESEEKTVEKAEDTTPPDDGGDDDGDKDDGTGTFTATTATIGANGDKSLTDVGLAVITGATSSDTAVATAEFKDGKVTITSVKAGTAIITINGKIKADDTNPAGTGAKVSVTVKANGAITIGTITPPTAAVTYTLIYDDNKPSSVSYEYSVEGVPSAVTKIASGTTVTLTGTPTLEGCKFLGWMATKDGTDVITTVTIESSDVTVYAKWDDPRTANLTIESNKLMFLKTEIATLPSDATLIKEGTKNETVFKVRCRNSDNLRIGEPTSDGKSIPITVVKDCSSTLYIQNDANYNISVYIDIKDDSGKIAIDNKGSYSGVQVEHYCYLSIKDTQVLFAGQAVEGLTVPSGDEIGNKALSNYWTIEEGMQDLPASNNNCLFIDNNGDYCSFYFKKPCDNGIDLTFKNGDNTVKRKLTLKINSLTDATLTAEKLITTATIGADGDKTLDDVGLASITGATSSDTAVATAEFKDGKVTITSVKPGTAIITVNGKINSDDSAGAATGAKVSVTVAPDNKIIIGTITKAANTATYAVIYNGNKPEGSTRNVIGLPDMVTGKTANAKVTLTGSPTLRGYTFGGWMTAANGTSIVTSVTFTNADVTVYAKWDKSLTANLTIDSNNKLMFLGEEIATLPSGAILADQTSTGNNFGVNKDPYDQSASFTVGSATDNGKSIPVTIKEGESCTIYIKNTEGVDYAVMIDIKDDDGQIVIDKEGSNESTGGHSEESTAELYIGGTSVYFAKKAIEGLTVPQGDSIGLGNTAKDWTIAQAPVSGSLAYIWGEYFPKSDDMCFRIDSIRYGFQHGVTSGSLSDQNYYIDFRFLKPYTMDLTFKNGDNSVTKTLTLTIKSLTDVTLTLKNEGSTDAGK